MNVTHEGKLLFATCSLLFFVKLRAGLKGQSLALPEKENTESKRENSKRLPEVHAM